MRAKEQGPKQESIRDWNIHYNIRLLWNSTCTKKKDRVTNGRVLQVCYSLAAVGLGKKVWHTALADCAIDWEVVVANGCVYRENVCDEKRYLFLSWRYDWERCMCMKGASRHYLLLLARTSSGRLSRTILWLRRSRGVTISRSDSEDRTFAILWGYPRHSITDSNHEPLTESIELKNLKWQIITK